MLRVRGSSANVLRMSVLLPLVMAIPGFAGNQPNKSQNPPPPARPAAAAAAPKPVPTPTKPAAPPAQASGPGHVPAKTQINPCSPAQTPRQVQQVPTPQRPQAPPPPCGPSKQGQQQQQTKQQQGPPKRDQQLTRQQVSPVRRDPQQTGQQVPPVRRDPQQTGQQVPPVRRDPQQTGQQVPPVRRDPQQTGQQVPPVRRDPQQTGQQVPPVRRDPQQTGQQVPPVRRDPQQTGQQVPPVRRDPQQTGQQVPPVRRDQQTYTTSKGDTVIIGKDHNIRTIQTKDGIRIEHNLHGQPTITSKTTGGDLVFRQGSSNIYVQGRETSFPSGNFIKRTGVTADGKLSASLYQVVPFNNHNYTVLAPTTLYSPIFLTWMTGSWSQPVPGGASAWVWNGAPGPGYYGFSPYQQYAGPSYWLTDYVIANTLEDAYVDQTGLPSTLTECESGTCGTWTWNGAQYDASWSDGSIAKISVMKWDGSAIVLSRVDNAGRSTSFTATYTGRLTSSTAFAGTAAYSWPGHGSGKLAWNASLPAPIQTVAADSPAPTADDAPMYSGISGGDAFAQVKQAVNDEVKATLAAEKKASEDAENGIPAPADQLPPVLDPNRPTFVVATDLMVSADGQDCSLTQGDFLTRKGPPDGNQMVQVQVSASKKSDCAPGKMVAISVDDLQEMRNRFQERLDRGEKEFAAKQGTGDIPKAPDISTVVSNVPKPQPDPNAAMDLKQQQVQASAAEARATAGPQGGQ
jgi:hypothetical protein